MAKGRKGRAEPVLELPPDLAVLEHSLGTFRRRVSRLCHSVFLQETTSHRYSTRGHERSPSLGGTEPETEEEHRRLLDGVVSCAVGLQSQLEGLPENSPVLLGMLCPTPHTLQGSGVSGIQRGSSSHTHSHTSSGDVGHHGHGPSRISQSIHSSGPLYRQSALLTNSSSMRGSSAWTGQRHVTPTAIGARTSPTLKARLHCNMFTAYMWILFPMFMLGILCGGQGMWVYMRTPSHLELVNSVTNSTLSMLAVAESARDMQLSSLGKWDYVGTSPTSCVGPTQYYNETLILLDRNACLLGMHDSWDTDICQPTQIGWNSTDWHVAFHIQQEAMCEGGVVMYGVYDTDTEADADGEGGLTSYGSDYGFQDLDTTYDLGPQTMFSIVRRLGDWANNMLRMGVDDMCSEELPTPAVDILLNMLPSINGPTFDSAPDPMVTLSLPPVSTFPYASASASATQCQTGNVTSYADNMLAQFMESFTGAPNNKVLVAYGSFFSALCLVVLLVMPVYVVPMVRLPRRLTKEVVHLIGLPGIGMVGGEGGRMERQLLYQQRSAPMSPGGSDDGSDDLSLSLSVNRRRSIEECGGRRCSAKDMEREREMKSAAAAQAVSASSYSGLNFSLTASLIVVALVFLCIAIHALLISHYTLDMSVTAVRETAASGLREILIQEIRFLLREAAVDGYAYPSNGNGASYINTCMADVDRKAYLTHAIVHRLSALSSLHNGLLNGSAALNLPGSMSRGYPSRSYLLFADPCLRSHMGVTGLDADTCHLPSAYPPHNDLYPQPMWPGTISQEGEGVECMWDIMEEFMAEGVSTADNDESDDADDDQSFPMLTGLDPSLRYWLQVSASVLLQASPFVDNGTPLTRLPQFGFAYDVGDIDLRQGLDSATLLYSTEARRGLEPLRIRMVICILVGILFAVIGVVFARVCSRRICNSVHALTCLFLTLPPTALATVISRKDRYPSLYRVVKQLNGVDMASLEYVLGNTSDKGDKGRGRESKPDRPRRRLFSLKSRANIGAIPARAPLLGSSLKSSPDAQTSETLPLIPEESGGGAEADREGGSLEGEGGGQFSGDGSSIYRLQHEKGDSGGEDALTTAVKPSRRRGGKGMRRHPSTRAPYEREGERERLMADGGHTAESTLETTTLALSPTRRGADPDGVSYLSVNSPSVSDSEREAERQGRGGDKDWERHSSLSFFTSVEMGESQGYSLDDRRESEREREAQRERDAERERIQMDMLLIGCLGVTPTGMIKFDDRDVRNLLGIEDLVGTPIDRVLYVASGSGMPVCLPLDQLMVRLWRAGDRGGQTKGRSVFLRTSAGDLLRGVCVVKSIHSGAGQPHLILVLYNSEGHTG
ncbi:hypothetical protein KIPB_007467 [Kipferlia bialata]|uniref:Uncharacterized protein n=1 Tax=Kipferlia bialata TaxID=797122 RepID=A0A9K3D031_9EUKA|nr:hypothetical protein KIPB_007467 [Kipferlia bialata]|eukprot:g7467.t1